MRSCRISRLASAAPTGNADALDARTDLAAKAAQAQDKAYVNSSAMPKPARIEPALASVRQPIARPVKATIDTHKAAWSRSASERPTSTADRHIGKVENRSIAPVVISETNPTAVPMAAVVRFNSISPGIAKSLYVPPWIGTPEPKT